MMNSFTKKGASIEKKIKPTPSEVERRSISSINISGKKPKSNSGKEHRLK